MKLKMTKLLCFFLLLSLINCDTSNTFNSRFPASKIYYVDSDAGNNFNSGLSRNKAWASLEKVNDVVYNPGDKILFKAGTSYTGQLVPRGSGSEKAPVIINKYGNGDKPMISGHGKYNTFRKY